jgi:hypothetical protein
MKVSPERLAAIALKAENEYNTHTPPVVVHIERDECDIRTTDFSLHFTTNGSGYSFPCMSDGRVITHDFTEVAWKSLSTACDRFAEWERVHVRAFTIRERLCMCGSGERSTQQFDARGIFLTSTCPSCHKGKMGGYRRDVLENSRYECDEPIDYDY